MMVAQLLANYLSVSKVQGLLFVPAIVQFMELWQTVHLMPTLSSEPNTFIWELTLKYEGHLYN
jgi:hypothetical protein